MWGRAEETAWPVWRNMAIGNQAAGISMCVVAAGDMARRKRTSSEKCNERAEEVAARRRGLPSLRGGVAVADEKALFCGWRYLLMTTHRPLMRRARGGGRRREEKHQHGS